MSRHKQKCSQYNGIDCIGFAHEELSQIFRMQICAECAEQVIYAELADYPKEKARALEILTEINKPPERKTK